MPSKLKRKRNVDGEQPRREGQFRGSSCPNCRASDRVNYGAPVPIKDVPSMLKRKCACASCGATWTEELWTSYYRNLRVPSAKQKKAAERKARADNLLAERQLYKLIGCQRPIGNEQRQWVVCTMCGMVQFYDYIPFGLGSPIHTSACGCWQPDYGWMGRATPVEALAAYHKYKPKKPKT